MIIHNLRQRPERIRKWRLHGLIFVKLTEYTKEKEELEMKIEEKLLRFVELQEMVDKFNVKKSADNM